jgi:2-oxoglutarate ferredoxin oxidoreductase subunit alpha
MRELVDGATAIVNGALAAGCDFFAGYPITPASSILGQMLDRLPPHGGVAIQAEDEIAAIGMCVGATLAGARAMTATSGPGLSLMSENVGLAVMGEVPLVIVDVQRLGPATGGATTVGQGDVQFVRWGAPGGQPVIALAPSSIVECHLLVQRAFALAEQYRSPVFLVTDKELVLTAGTVEVGSFRDEHVPPRARVPAPGNPYRYEPPEGVAPLGRLGDPGALRFTGSTHDERGFLTRDPATVERLARHLEAKIEAHAAELELVVADPQEGAETLLVAYGVTAGALREAVRRARRAGRRVAGLIVQGLWPLPERALREAARGVRRVVVAELNQGQYRREVAACLRDVPVEGLQRLDGQRITPEQLLEVVS